MYGAAGTAGERGEPAGRFMSHEGAHGRKGPFCPMKVLVVGQRSSCYLMSRDDFDKERIDPNRYIS